MEPIQFTKEIKNKWLEALRSGKYKKGSGRLRDEKNNYCCLGVLCDIMPTLKIDKSGYSGWIGGYQVFNDMFGSSEITDRLVFANDNSYAGDYRHTIPIVEELKTID